MKSEDETIKIKNISSRRKNIKDENILKKLEIMGK